MRKILIASGIFFLIFFYGLVLSQTNISVIAEELEPKNPEGFFDYRGATNAHSNRGVGSGSPLDVIKAAQESNLDFLFITDLNAFNAPAIPEGYHRKMLVMSAEEISYLDSHLILFDPAQRHEFDSLGQAQTLLADLLSQSGTDAQQDFIVLAHPFKPGFQWSGNYPSGLDAVEVINLKSIWRQAWENSKPSFFWSSIVYPFNSQLALLRLYEEPTQELALWDQLSTIRPTVGLIGHDATARTGSHFNFPSYQSSFNLVANHILLRSELTGEAEGDRKKILTALANGNSYMSLDILGNPKGFVAYIQDGDRIHEIGSSVKFTPGMKLVVKLPQKPKTPFEAAFLKDGQHMMSSNSVDSELEIHGPGVYRVIVRVFVGLTLPDGVRWMTWIYTNPFYVK